MATTPSQQTGPTETAEAYCAGSSCAGEVSRGVGVLSGRWAVPVLEALYFARATIRFRELQRQVPGISQKELAKQLVSFVNHGVARHVVQTDDARRIGYLLAVRGIELMTHMEALGEWAKGSTGITETATPAEPPQAHEPATWLSPLSTKHRLEEPSSR